jgi:hypothetical protein
LTFSISEAPPKTVTPTKSAAAHIPVVFAGAFHDAEIEIGERPELWPERRDGAVEKPAVINGRLRN